MTPHDLADEFALGLDPLPVTPHPALPIPHWG
jgi:hypothetical protein